MTSSSNMYIQLQQIYQARARAIWRPSPAISVRFWPTWTNHQVQLLRWRSNVCVVTCSAFLRVICCRLLANEYSESNISELYQLGNPCELVYYVILRAADQFYSLFKTYPGCGDGSIAAVVSQLKSILTSLLQNWGLVDVSIGDEHVTEFYHYNMVLPNYTLWHRM